MHTRILLMVLLLLVTRPALNAQQSLVLPVAAVDASAEDRSDCAIVYREATTSRLAWTYVVVNTSGIVQAIWPPGTQNRPKQYSSTDPAFVVAAHGSTALLLSQVKPGWKVTFDHERMNLRFVASATPAAVVQAPSPTAKTTDTELTRELAALNGTLRTTIDRVSEALRFYPAVAAAALALVAASLFFFTVLLLVGAIGVRRWWRSELISTARDQASLLLPKLATTCDITNSALNRADPDSIYAQIGAVVVERLMPVEEQLHAILIESRAISASTSESTSVVRELTATRISPEQLESFGGRLIHALTSAKMAQVVPATQAASAVDVISLLTSIDASLRSLVLREAGATGDSILSSDLLSASEGHHEAAAGERTPTPVALSLADDFVRPAEVTLPESSNALSKPDVLETLTGETAARVETATIEENARFVPSSDAAAAVERFRYICEGSHEPAAARDLLATLDRIADSRSEREFCVRYAEALVKIFYLYPTDVAVEEISKAKLLEGVPLLMDVPKAGSIAPPVGAERFRWNDMPEAYRSKFQRMLQSRARNFTLPHHVVCIVRPKLTYKPGGVGDVLQKPAILLLQDVQDILARAKAEL